MDSESLNKLNNIYNTIYDENSKLSINEKNNIYDQIDDFNTYIITKTQNTIRKNSEKSICELENMKKTIKIVPVINKYSHQIRVILNSLMNKMWERNCDRLKHFDYIMLAKDTQFLKKKFI